MSLNDYLLVGLVEYGLPVLGLVLLITATGVPLPATLSLLVAGALIRQGELNGTWVIATAFTATMIGDQIGYGIGRWGSERLIRRISRLSGGASRWSEAEAVAQRWGGLGIFLTRWLLTPVGPLTNIISGVARYPWLAFFCWDLVGEAVWISVYVGLGWWFSDQTQDLNGTIGNLTWAILGIVVLGGLFQLLRRANARRA